VKVLVYVEGTSDRSALEVLLRPIIEDGQRNKVGIRFLPQGGKDPLLDEVGRKAANDLLDEPRDWHFALPDLYPMAKYDATHNRHRSFSDLRELLRARFVTRANKLGLSGAVQQHFRVHCLKHDLEALVLGTPDMLRSRLRTGDALKGHWRQPVEDQNDGKPPKRIVEELFCKYARRKYVDTSDAPWILGRTSLDDIERACAQRFKPFVDELRVLAAGKEP
jgi:hypothetical protein